MLLITALVISLIPVSDVEAASTSDFEIEGMKLLKYSGTAEIVSIPDDIKVIGEEAFAGNSHVLKIEVNDKCDSIEYGAFANCTNLRSVDLGDGVEEVGAAAFSNDPSLKNVSMGANVKKIGTGIFAGDTALESVSISASNKYLTLDNNVLYNSDMSKLYCMLPAYNSQTYDMPLSVNEVLGYAFWGNDSLVNVHVGSGLVSVPEYTFSNCKNLKMVYIPLPVRSIDAKAFEDCVNLMEVECPDSMTKISDSAFDGCPKVTINALPGSYAYKFGQELAKSLIDEVEYEDVENAATVTQESVESHTPVTRDDNQTTVIEGNPHDGDKTSTNTNDGESNIESTPSPVNQRTGGVMSGSDFITYRYVTNESEYPQGQTLGASSIVSGNAMIFIDNNASVRQGTGNTGVDLSVDNDDGDSTTHKLEKKKDTASPSNEISSESDTENNDNNQLSDIGSVIKDNANKGIDFPKFTVVNNSIIASQAYYLDSDLTSFDMPDGITTIGDFAFARSGLTSIAIPDGVTSIGYGAFYHCDNLSAINVPDSVDSVASYAFNDTAYVNNSNNEFVTVGDGILIAYKGDDVTVNIPEGVKIIADGTFRDNLGITAVNFPDSLVKIGEDAFNGCTNLLVANRGYNVTNIGANAFKGTKLSNVTIYSQVNSIGTGAYDLNNGTDTVIFEGEVLPTLTEGTQARRLSNDADRTYAFGNMKNAIVSSNINNLTGTILEPGQYGFKGVVKDTFGNTVSDNTNGVYERNDGQLNIAVNSAFIDPNSVSASITGDTGSYNLHIIDSQNAKESISLAYSELYGGRTPDNLVGLDISLTDASDTLKITKLGKQTVDVTMAIPNGVEPANMHLVSLDADGQLEAVPYTYSEDGNSIQFKCKHFSPYGLYNYAGLNAAVNKTGDRVKDNTPDTGDVSIHPKWFLVIGCIALAVIFILLSIKDEKGYIDNRK